MQVHPVAAKAGIDAMIRTLAIEWGRYGIRLVVEIFAKRRKLSIFADPRSSSCFPDATSSHLALSTIPKELPVSCRPLNVMP